MYSRRHPQYRRVFFANQGDVAYCAAVIRGGAALRATSTSRTDQHTTGALTGRTPQLRGGVCHCCYSCCLDLEGFQRTIYYPTPSSSGTQTLCPTPPPSQPQLRNELTHLDQVLVEQVTRKQLYERKGALITLRALITLGA